MDLKIRFAEPADADFLEPEVYIPAEILRRKIEWREMLVAEAEGELAGLLQLEYLWSLVPYIALIRVAEERRRRGIGRALLGFAEEYLREQGHRTLYSSSQADEAEPQKWHRRMGFEECGILAGVNEGVAEVFFRKDLG